MTFHTFLLRCADGSYYVGHADDLETRVAQHQAGEIPGHTASRLPLDLVWSVDIGIREEALIAERQIKGWSRKRKEALIAGDEDVLQALLSKARDTPAQTALATGATEGQADAARRGDETPPVAPPPVIILVRPQLGENIGKAARAMLNFGLTELRLVAPRDGWPNPDAGPAAAGADIVLAQAQLFETLAEAVADCPHVYATTVRKRGVAKPVMRPDQAAQAIRAAPGRSAIVFGPERSGLETDDVALARTILTVPINPEFGSLNLAQAVILCAYEWSRQADLDQPTLNDQLAPAPQVELEGMITQLETLLQAAGYFFPPARTTATKRTLRSMFTKPGWNSLEIRTMRGVLSTLGRPRRR